MKRFFEVFKKKGPNNATIEPSGASFEVEKDKTLLQTALSNDIDFPFHCTVGTCGQCRCRLVEGDVRPIMDFSYSLSAHEIEEGYILACQSLLKTDIVVELVIDTSHPSIKVESFQGCINATRMLTHDIMEVSVGLDRPISFSAGQFADITLPGVDRHRSYSFACAPSENGLKEITFQVKKVPGGHYTEWLFEKDRVNEKFELHGPSGSFWLRKSDAPILCVAGGSGMAPLKSILEDALAKGINRPVTYLYGARQQKDLFCIEEMQQLADKWPTQFKFIPVLSDEPEDSDWQGKRGLVTEFTNEDNCGFEIKKSHAYLCGSPGMIDAVLVDLESKQVSLDNTHYDKFLDSRQLDV